MTVRQMFIPTIGTEFRVEEDWTFDLYAESRNNPLRKALGLSRASYSTSPTYDKVTLKKGITLIVDRIYIRNNAKQYDSITFRIGDVPDGVPKKFRKKRFWAKLGDINNIQFTPVSGVPRSDGLLFVLLKVSPNTYQAPSKGYDNTFTELDTAKNHVIEKHENPEKAYIFQVPPGKEFPDSYQNRTWGAGIPGYDVKGIESKYDLVYEPVGPLGKGRSVDLRRSLYKRKHRGTPNDPRDFFMESEDREAIEEADSIYVMVDDLRRSSRSDKSSDAFGSVIFRSGSKWQARLTGKMRLEAPDLHKKICDIWDTEGYIPLRTLSEGVSLLEDFFEENLDSYGKALPPVESYNYTYWRS